MFEYMGIVCRPSPWWPLTVAMVMAIGAAWLVAWGQFAACGAAVVANLIVEMSMPRRFGCWTE